MKNWFEHLQSFLLGKDVQKISDLGAGPLLLILVLALASALVSSWMYVRFYGGRATGTQIHRAFPLLGISIAAIFVCIQFSLALSLGLLGALSIIRFRTPIKEPEEVAFIMLVIATSIACATFNLLFLAAILATAFGALKFINHGPRFCQPRAGHGSLIVRMTEADYEQSRTELLHLIERLLPKAQMDSLALDGTTCLLTYIFPQLSPTALAETEREIRALAPGCGVNVFYSRAENLV
jgi:hypothetical protein